MTTNDVNPQASVERDGDEFQWYHYTILVGALALAGLVALIMGLI